MVEPQIVVLDVAGSSPVGHPISFYPPAFFLRSRSVARGLPRHGVAFRAGFRLPPTLNDRAEANCRNIPRDFVS